VVSLTNSKKNLTFTARALFICLSFFLFSFVPLAGAITWNVDVTTLTVNNTIYWDGHTFDYLNSTYYNQSEIDSIVTGNISGYVPYTGATDDLDLGYNNLYIGGSNSSFNSTLLIDGNLGNTNATLVIRSGNNMYSCINLTEGTGTLGCTICYDGSGSNRLVFGNSRTGFEYMWIDRDSGIIHFNNDTIFTSITMENLTVTGDVNISGSLISGENITADYFFGDGSGLTNVAGTQDNNLNFYMNGSMYTNITYNLTAGDVDEINVQVEAGDKFIFGGTLT